MVRDLSQVAVASLQAGYTMQTLEEFAKRQGKPFSPAELKEIRRLRGCARLDCFKAGIKVEKLIK